MLSAKMAPILPTKDRYPDFRFRGRGGEEIEEIEDDLLSRARERGVPYSLMLSEPPSRFLRLYAGVEEARNDLHDCLLQRELLRLQDRKHRNMEKVARAREEKRRSEERDVERARLRRLAEEAR